MSLIRTLRAALEARGVGYVLAIAGNRRLPTAGSIRADVPAAAGLATAAGRAEREDGQEIYDWSTDPERTAP